MTPSLSSVTLSFPISSFLLRPQDLPQLQALSVSEGTPTPTTALAAPSEKHNALNAADQPGHLQRHPRHNEDIGESSSPGDPYAAGPSALERELHACQEEVRSMNVQIHRMRYRISMRKVAEEWYPTERRSNEDQLWLCKKRTAELAKQHKRLLAETKASQSQIAKLKSKIESLKKARPAEP